MDTLKERLRGRGTESEETYIKRLGIAQDELLRAKEYDYIVINDELSVCADDICAIISAEKSRYANMKAFIENI